MPVIANDNIEKYEKFDAWLYEAFFNGNLKNEYDIERIGKLLSKSSKTIKINHSKKSLRAVVYKFKGLEIHGFVEQTKDKKIYI